MESQGHLHCRIKVNGFSHACNAFDPVQHRRFKTVEATKHHRNVREQRLPVFHHEVKRVVVNGHHRTQFNITILLSVKVQQRFTEALQRTPLGIHVLNQERQLGVFRL